MFLHVEKPMKQRLPHVESPELFAAIFSLVCVFHNVIILRVPKYIISMYSGVFVKKKKKRLNRTN